MQTAFLPEFNPKINPGNSNTTGNSKNKTASKEDGMFLETFMRVSNDTKGISSQGISKEEQVPEGIGILNSSLLDLIREIVLMTGDNMQASEILEQSQFENLAVLLKEFGFAPKEIISIVRQLLYKIDNKELAPEKLADVKAIFQNQLKSGTVMPADEFLGKLKALLAQYDLKPSSVVVSRSSSKQQTWHIKDVPTGNHQQETNNSKEAHNITASQEQHQANERDSGFNRGLREAKVQAKSENAPVLQKNLAAAGGAEKASAAEERVVNRFQEPVLKTEYKTEYKIRPGGEPDVINKPDSGWNKGLQPLYPDSSDSDTENKSSQQPGFQLQQKYQAGIQQGIQQGQIPEHVKSLYNSAKVAHNVMSQITEKLTINTLPDTTEMLLQLKPESLGKLNLTVLTTNGTVTAKFEAENYFVKGIIEANLTNLKDALSDQGIKVDQLVVNVGTGRDNSSGYSGYESPLYQNQRGKGNKMPTNNEYDLAYQPDTNQSLSNNTWYGGVVDYLA